MRPNVAIIAGEVSGDLVGAALARALYELCPGAAMWGMGGARMTAAGVELVADSDRWGAIGVVEALRVYPELRYRVYPRVCRQMRARRPAVAVLIDFGAFNMRVAAVCRAAGIPVLYYMPPGSWRRRGRVRGNLPALANRIAAPFPWAAERLAAAGASAVFVGHPLLDLVKPTVTRAQFAERLGLEPGAPTIGLLPGSRVFEVDCNTPALLGAADLIHAEVQGAQFVVGCASDTARSRVEQAVRHWQAEGGPETQPPAGSRRPRAEPELVTPEGIRFTPEQLAAHRAAQRRAGTPAAGRPPVVLTQDATHDVMAHSDVLLVCSGTATLEAAIMGTPMVILYRGTRLMEFEQKLRRVRPEHIGMPNIIAGARVVPELIQHEASPRALADHALRLLRDPQARAQARRALEKVRSALGEPGASVRVAQMAADLGGLDTCADQAGGAA